MFKEKIEGIFQSLADAKAEIISDQEMSKEEKILAIEDLESKAETELLQLRNEAYQSGLDLDTVNSIFADVYSDG